jgi:hypothetical protein
LLFASVTSSGSNAVKHFQIDIIDVRRAEFYAKVRRLVYVQLSPKNNKEGMFGILKQETYGTRDAAQNWQPADTEFPKKNGLKSSLVRPWVFLHEVQGLHLGVYGDDFTIASAELCLDWFRGLISGIVDVKFPARLGPDAKDDKAVRIQNRVVELTEEGLTLT